MGLESRRPLCLVHQNGIYHNLEIAATKSTNLTDELMNLTACLHVFFGPATDITAILVQESLISLKIL